MDRIVQRVQFEKPVQTKATRVAAYGRVSSGKDTMLHSLSQQVNYFSTLIQSHSGWLYAGVYSDEAFTGTKEDRKAFQQLLTDCREGKIDLVITKSISRFARNTVTLLEAVRELKNLGIGVYFEEQNINTLTAEGELMLTILASYAQEESLSVSENQLWRIKRNFEEGKPWNGRMLGYRYEKGVFMVVPEEAELVKSIFADYLSGKGIMAIANKLNKQGIPSPRDGKWCKTAIMKILKQYAYTGNLLLQRTVVLNHLDKKSMVNRGEKPMYHIENSHEPIISLDVFNRVQEQIAKRAEKHGHTKQNRHRYPLSGFIECGGCGKHYTRKHTAGGIVWICPTFNSQGKAACPAKQIPEETLLQVIRTVLDEKEITTELLHSRLTAIRAEKNNRLVFCFPDGKQIVKRWNDRSRADSWTAEMRAKAKLQKTKETNA